jgi:hypothetical protein
LFLRHVTASVIPPHTQLWRFARSVGPDVLPFDT